MIDLVIRGGTIYDGTGRVPFGGDIAVHDGRIVAVGDVDERGRRELDADGLIVTPGFIDIHTHFDGQATWDGMLAPSCWHGVTTVVLGNCGVGFAPVKEHQHDALVDTLEGVEDIPGSALHEGMTWGWETFPEYLEALDQVDHVMDLAAHMPHTALRLYVMGDRGMDPDQLPSEEELAVMATLVEEAVAHGAVGVATSRTTNHRTSHGDVIGTVRAGAAELMALAEGVRRAGSGVIQLISDAYQTGDLDLLKAELDLIELAAVTSGAPLSFTVIQPPGRPDQWQEMMRRVEQLTERGLPVRGQVSTRPIGQLLGLETSRNPFDRCPSYEEVAALPLAERVASMRVPERRARILAEFDQSLDPASPIALPERERQRLVSMFDALFVLDDPVDYDLKQSDSIAFRAARSGQSPASLMYELLLENGGTQLLYWATINFARRNFDDLAAMVAHPHVLFGLGDAGAHVRAICDGSMTTSCLTVWGRDRPDGQRVPIEALVHGLTQRNARHLGWSDRGVLAAGALADINLIDFGALGCGHPYLVNDLPTGAGRLLQRAYGYQATVKSGRVTFEGGEATGERPGEVVRGGTPRHDS